MWNNIIKIASNVWLWLQGKKTAIGSLMLLLTREQWFLDILKDGSFESFVIWFLTTFGSILAGVGIISMVGKSINKKTYYDIAKENKELNQN